MTGVHIGTCALDPSLRHATPEYATGGMYGAPAVCGSYSITEKCRLLVRAHSTLPAQNSPSYSHSHGVPRLKLAPPSLSTPPASPRPAPPPSTRTLIVISTHAHSRSRPPPAAARPTTRTSMARAHRAPAGSMTGSRARARRAIAPTPNPDACPTPRISTSAHAATRTRSRVAAAVTPPPPVHTMPVSSSAVAGVRRCTTPTARSTNTSPVFSSAHAILLLAQDQTEEPSGCWGWRLVGWMDVPPPIDIRERRLDGGQDGARAQR
ncbi:hypothetical protein DFH09DRAFT_1475426 [Mycena vulgaris]|nr:hypothetical protein DFH09DRAFT_1475426 [Mycena vulgaris]